MKKLRLVLLIGVISSILYSCCTKMDCEGFDDLNEIQLKNFLADEVDSISVEIFKSGSNFTDRIDSSFTQPIGCGANTINCLISVKENIHLDHEYKVTIHSINQSYTLTDFKTRKEECNCPSDKVNVIESYSLNGEKQSNLPLAISK